MLKTFENNDLHVTFDADEHGSVVVLRQDVDCIALDLDEFLVMLEYFGWRKA